MHFDDRLATVLRLPASGPGGSRAIARIQFRQLIDLLGRTPSPQEGSPIVDAALARIEDLGTILPASERARILREPMMRLANPELVARLAASEPEVASAAIAAAHLDDADWLDLIPALPIRARGILRHRRGLSARVDALLERLGIADRGLPPVQAPAGEALANPSLRPRLGPRPGLFVIDGSGPPPAPRAPDQTASGIGAIVRKIEAFRQAKGNGTESVAAQDTGAALPAVLVLDFMTDTSGRVTSADGPTAPAIVGWSLAGDATQPDLAAAVRHRQPISGALVSLALAPVLGGPWRLDAVPRFEGANHRFVGYAGRLRRPAPPAADASAPADGEIDRMRQILHELRTPANAMQVAAEIIQQQLYGPAPHEYRALAATIAGDTAQILAGFEELDRLVKLETGGLVPQESGCDLGVVIGEAVARLRAWTGPRASGFTLPQPLPALPVHLSAEEATRLVWRLLAGLAGTAEPGEVLAIRIEDAGERVVLSISLPQALASPDASNRPAPPHEPTRALFAGTFGIGFTLRLAAAEARAAGGSLERTATRLSLRVPGLTTQAADHTQAS